MWLQQKKTQCIARCSDCFQNVTKVSREIFQRKDMTDLKVRSWKGNSVSWGLRGHNIGRNCFTTYNILLFRQCQKQFRESFKKWL